MDKAKVSIGIFRVLLYIGIGVYFLTIKNNGEVNSISYLRIFGVAAIVYGIFRAFRVYQQFKNE